jgi:4-hydroxymandelate oxidase
VNVFELEAAAEARLSGPIFAEISGSDRKPFDRITFRPRMLVDSRELDLSVELFGKRMFAPVLVGPVANQARFHGEGELAMVRGAATAKAAVVVADRASHPIERIAAQSEATLWYQVQPDEDMQAVSRRAQAAAKAGCQAICLTVAGAEARGPALDWAAIDRLRQAIPVPLLLKGVMSPDDAQMAVERGVQGIVVSNYRGRMTTALAASIEVLPGIADAVGKKVPVLVDGGFRRGSDVLKALALGARAVLMARPAVWGLAAYGPEGVHRVLDLVQSELARDMVMCGKANLAAIDRGAVRIHTR